MKVGFLLSFESMKITIDKPLIEQLLEADEASGRQPLREAISLYFKADGVYPSSEGEEYEEEEAGSGMIGCHRRSKEAILLDRLEERFLSILKFGTAGLRGAMGVGFNRMNSLTVMRTSQGLATHLLKQWGKSLCAEKGVLIGYDGRHYSKSFAHATAAVFLQKNFRVLLMNQPVPTPFVAFGVISFECVAGVMITASHNPKTDNGYKVYAKNGAQIIPPDDEDIFKEIQQCMYPQEGVLAFLDKKTGFLLEEGANCRIPQFGLISSSNAEKKSFSTPLLDPFEELKRMYTKSIFDDFSELHLKMRRDMKITYTAMHGVGYEFIREIYKKFGYNEESLVPVESQCSIDPDFPTVSFPNPEEPNALRLAMEAADKAGSGVVLANDPDADRLAVAEKTEEGWRVLTGDEVGVLLASYLINLHVKIRQRNPSDLAVISSIVSSGMLQAMAQKEGLHFSSTMTGFKWIMNEALSLKEKHKVETIFAYEEALGYAATMKVCDKDGISAFAIFNKLLDDVYVHTPSKTLSNRLDELQRRYGRFVSMNSYALCADPCATMEIFDSFRNGGKYHWQVGKFALKRILDLTNGYDSAAPNQLCVDYPSCPSSQFVMLEFENSVSVKLRASGTEPKIKWYCEATDDYHSTHTQMLTQKLKCVVREVILYVLKPESYPIKLRQDTVEMLKEATVQSTEG